MDMFPLDDFMNKIRINFGIMLELYFELTIKFTTK